jgi:hypothetical protein
MQKQQIWKGMFFKQQFYLLFALSVILFSSSNLHAQVVLNFTIVQTPSPVKLFMNADTIVVKGYSLVLGKTPLASGGTAPYKYVWKPSFNLNSDTLENPIATPDTNTLYTVFVTDSKGCTQTDSVYVEVKEAPVGLQGLLLNQKQFIHVEVYDVMGRLVRTETLNGSQTTSPELDLKELTAGVYHLKIEHKGNWQSRKLIIQ